MATWSKKPITLVSLSSALNATTSMPHTIGAAAMRRDYLLGRRLDAAGGMAERAGGMTNRSRTRVTLALALFALWAQALWPALSLLAAPGAVVLCTGAGVTTVADPLAPPAPPGAHDCPCCMVQPSPLPPPAAPVVARATAPLPVAYAAPAVARPLDPAYRLAWGRAPPAA